MDVASQNGARSEDPIGALVAGEGSFGDSDDEVEVFLSRMRGLCTTMMWNQTKT